MLMLNHLQTFLTAARVKSFTRAGRELGMTQPAVSGQIAQLEEELGEKLFNRTGRENVLTDAGRIVLQAAKDVTDRLDVMRKDLAGLSQLRGGCIRIGTSHVIGLYLLPKILTHFRANFPGIQVQVAVLSAQTIDAQALENNFDIAIVGEGDRFISNNVNVKAVGVDELVVAASKRYVGRHFGQTHLMVDQAADKPFILLGPATGSSQALRNELKNLGIHLRSVMEMDDVIAVKRSVSYGAGLAVLPRFLVERELQDGSFVELQIGKWKPSRNILLLWQRDRQSSDSTETFTQFLQQKLSQGAPQPRMSS